MGSPEDEPGRYSDEGPQHRVTISQTFAVGKYEVTRGQFESFVNATGYDAGDDWHNPGFSQTNAHPVVYVSWHDARAYVRWLSRRTGEIYRLLSEAEWEYVARAGTTTAYHFGNTISPSQANFNENNEGTFAVGRYPANAFGLHDVHGNMWEWVEDCKHDDYDSAPKDGSAWVSNCDDDIRVLRGGSWGSSPRFLRSAVRYWIEASDRDSDVGFRVARTLTPLTPLLITSPSDDTRYKLSTADATPQTMVVVVEGSNADDTLTMNFRLNRQGASVVSVPTSLSFPEDIGNTRRELRFNLTAVDEGDATVTIVVADSLGNTDEVDIYVEVDERGSIPETFRDCPNCPEMVTVPSGSFLMGSPEDEPGRYSDEGPQHRVTIPQPFAVGKYEVTHGQFRAFVNATEYDAGYSWLIPILGYTNAHPVLAVSWHDAQAYVKWLSRRTGESYRLLSEAEWEYVARAGTTTAYHFGNTISPSQVSFDQKNARTAVGSYPANAFGLHDVHGNVFEWVEDCWHDNYNGAPTDGSAWVSNCDGNYRVLRGGSWGYFPRALRSAFRIWLDPSDRVSLTAGIRVARTLTP